MLGIKCRIPNGEVVAAARAARASPRCGRRQCRASPAAAHHRATRTWRKPSSAWTRRSPAWRAAPPPSERVPPMAAPRHFLDLSDLSAETLRGIIDDSRRHEVAIATTAPRPSARRPRARDDLRQAVDPHARVVRRRHAPARRRDDHADRRRDAARARRDDRRHRARALPLCRCDHDPHPRPRGAARACRTRHRAGDQRPDAAVASLPDHGRPPDLRGASRPDRRARRSPGPAMSTTCSPRWCMPRRASRFRLDVASPPELQPPDAARRMDRQEQGARCAS